MSAELQDWKGLKVILEPSIKASHAVRMKLRRRDGCSQNAPSVSKTESGHQRVCVVGGGFWGNRQMNKWASETDSNGAPVLGAMACHHSPRRLLLRSGQYLPVTLPPRHNSNEPPIKRAVPFQITSQQIQIHIVHSLTDLSRLVQYFSVFSNHNKSSKLYNTALRKLVFLKESIVHA